ncbi:MAG: hypothetical protein AB3N16_04940 [Flavobacteriaceae bacterium]
MKKLFIVLAIALLIMSFAMNTSPYQNEPLSIEGTWELVSHYNYDGETIADTVYPTDGYRQIKMYYNGKVMWTRYVPTDSVEWFGYGSYSITDTSLTEQLEYMSSSMRKVANPDMIWTMRLQLEKNRYSQIFTDADGIPVNSENYRRLD